MKKRLKKYLRKRRWVVALAMALAMALAIGGQTMAFWLIGGQTIALWLIGSQTTALWPALYKVTKKQLSECLGDNFPVLAIR